MAREAGSGYGKDGGRLVGRYTKGRYMYVQGGRSTRR